MFPSLTGVIRFLIVAGNDIKIIGKKVSVPYRGYSFFNEKIAVNGLGGSDSFRPLQGLFVF